LISKYSLKLNISLIFPLLHHRTEEIKRKSKISSPLEQKLKVTTN
jgi:hypothetical protein